MDLRVRKEASPIRSCVNLSRVRKKEDIFIFRDFAWDLLTRPTLLGPHFFLQEMAMGETKWAELQANVSSRKVPTGNSHTNLR